MLIKSSIFVWHDWQAFSHQAFLKDSNKTPTTSLSWPSLHLFLLNIFTLKLLRFYWKKKLYILNPFSHKLSIPNNIHGIIIIDNRRDVACNVSKISSACPPLAGLPCGCSLPFGSVVSHSYFLSPLCSLWFNYLKKFLTSRKIFIIFIISYLL